jgi:hypothetical protein
MFVGTYAAGADAIVPCKVDLPEPLCRQAQDHARDTPVANKQVGADANDRQRHFSREYLQEGDEVIHVMRLEHQFCQSAGLEPSHAVHRRIRRQPPTKVLDALTE